MSHKQDTNKRVLNAYKEIGETPLERINRLREDSDELKGETMGYAGRLDPMAEGVLLIMLGEENRKRKEYLHLPKEYTFEVLFGVSTDSYDILGKIESVSKNRVKDIKKRVIEEMPEFNGTFTQQYPPYSSQTVDGRALFEIARMGELGKTILPEKQVTVYNFDIETFDEITSENLLKIVKQRIDLVGGDFRQKEILDEWRKNLKSSSCFFDTVKIHVSCASGLYVRSIAHNLGKKIGIPSLALSIVRDSVGEFSKEGAIR